MDNLIVLIPLAFIAALAFLEFVVLPILLPGGREGHAHKVSGWALAVWMLCGAGVGLVIGDLVGRSMERTFSRGVGALLQLVYLGARERFLKKPLLDSGLFSWLTLGMFAGLVVRILLGL